MATNPDDEARLDGLDDDEDLDDDDFEEEIRTTLIGLGIDPDAPDRIAQLTQHTQAIADAHIATIKAHIANLGITSEHGLALWNELRRLPASLDELPPAEQSAIAWALTPDLRARRFVIGKRGTPPRREEPKPEPAPSPEPEWDALSADERRDYIEGLFRQIEAQALEPERRARVERAELGIDEATWQAADERDHERLHEVARLKREDADAERNRVMESVEWAFGHAGQSLRKLHKLGISEEVIWRFLDISVPLVCRHNLEIPPVPNATRWRDMRLDELGEMPSVLAERHRDPKDRASAMDSRREEFRKKLLALGPSVIDAFGGASGLGAMEVIRDVWLDLVRATVDEALASGSPARAESGGAADEESAPPPLTPKAKRKPSKHRRKSTARRR
jgi:hypothetical protein